MKEEHTFVRKRKSTLNQFVNELEAMADFVTDVNFSKQKRRDDEESGFGKLIAPPPSRLGEDKKDVYNLIEEHQSEEEDASREEEECFDLAKTDTAESEKNEADHPAVAVALDARIERLFHAIDTDKSGNISTSELEMVFEKCAQTQPFVRSQYLVMLKPKCAAGTCDAKMWASFCRALEGKGLLDGTLPYLEAATGLTSTEDELSVAEPATADVSKAAHETAPDVPLDGRSVGATLASEMTQEQQQQLVRLFDMIDLDGGGSLGLDEIQAFFSPSPGQPGQLPRALKLLDADGDGVITWREWVVFFEELHHRGHMDGTLKMLFEIASSKPAVSDSGDSWQI